ncbi:membrane protein insertase YidC [Luteimonas sp. Sa2BVA3]|uniref:Membrane protein insertase YidC n=1 Tax=Luteimonas colneyensis TaxID=2762230 RepID=A0ABR8UHY8_9GAMM|nr:membrane protein insertase YidC [Luteimonas colneyensis]MBD7987403.1 membrane protein insertase YidC [Luteimonas colneyensis]
MNQTRTFLIFAWLMVATLLWMEWGKEQREPLPAAQATTSVADSGATVPGAPPAVPGAAATPGAVPDAPQAAALPGVNAQAAAAPQAEGLVHVRTDVLDLALRGGAVARADLLGFPQTRDEGSAPVRMFDDAPERFYAAQSGWVSSTSAAPSHESGFVPESPGTDYALAADADTLEVPFVWHGADGVSIRRSYVFTRGSYVVEVRDTIYNRSDRLWQGHVYRQLVRLPQVLKTGWTNPESFSLYGATWFSPGEGYSRVRYADFADEGAVNARQSGGWLAMLQHHFFSAWIPGSSDEVTISLHTVPGPAGGMHHLVREVGPGLAVAPGDQASTSARLWVGPKLVGQIKAQGVTGLDRAVDYSRFSVFAVLGEGLFWILDKLHGLLQNWGWSIIGLVVVVKAILYPLSKAQYQSMAKMRKFQPRIQQLKERYGDDKQKFQVAMMELYKKEKINPVGGCLPVLLQMPIWLALYWVLLESVELRHAPWIGWIQDLTARDPWFILPVLNILVMWATQKLSPMVGMDPMQQKMMQLMPLVFGVFMIFFPSGLVLYWVTNGALGLLQQWWLIRKFADKPGSDKPDAGAKPAKATAGN